MSPVLVAIIQLVPLTAVAMYYGHRAMTLSWDDRPVPAWRQACFWSGLFLLCFVLFNPWGGLSDELIIAHMVEHLIIGDIASLLVVLGLTRSILQPVLSVRFFHRAQFLALPFFAFPLWLLDFYGWHVPPMYDLAYGGGLIHGLEHTCFFFFGCLMWMPLFGPLPMPSWFGPGWRIVYVGVVRLGAAALGNVLMWTGYGLYSHYAAGEAKYGISAVQDQSTAGVIMMVEGTFLFLGVLAWIIYQSSSRSIRKQELLDLAYMNGVAIDESRVERAVRSGHSELLEKRILAGRVGGERAGK